MNRLRRWVNGTLPPPALEDTKLRTSCLILQRQAQTRVAKASPIVFGAVLRHSLFQQRRRLAILPGGARLDTGINQHVRFAGTLAQGAIQRFTVLEE
jgi:hypothetical protein